MRSVEEFLEQTETVGLLIVRDGLLVHSRYARGVDETTQWPTWSVIKSFVSALVGIALHEGAIQALSDPITRYVPELVGSAYDGVPIAAALQMSSGASWNEDYADPESDVRRAGRARLAGGSLDAFAATLRREYPPGNVHRYNSTDTHVLGMVLRAATKRPLYSYLRAKLWEPLGMEDDGFWAVDGTGVEWAGAGFCATLRDWAKLGAAYLARGMCDGNSVVPAEWVQASTHASAPHVSPGHMSPLSPFGYGYQWWLPDASGAYAAIGIYNQYIYVDPARSTVIVKGSANRNFAASYDEAGYRDQEHMAMFRALAAA